ncbi:hypothetical protein CTheo_1966 [Ceratobasidium theobromae]|uniref:Ricin B lectin domain-containing protein n=1 Tax=Ceratobasidium theobromae TaxID=1582974 RepID=A0A5N5QSF9_9AGAM|nr:hypothetical protein CTheo_1966 [Ceratobasidium theobromae]
MSSYAIPPNPGTYYIVSVAAPKNVIEVPSCNEERVVCSSRNNEPNQQWYLQRSGRGYKIKNMKYGVYLATGGSKYGSPIGTSPVPTSWTLMRTHEGYSIQYGDEDKVVDLHYGLDFEGNVMHIRPVGGSPAHRRWKFEHIRFVGFSGLIHYYSILKANSDDVGGEEAETIEDQVEHLHQQLRAKNIQIALKDAELASKDRQLAQQKRELQAALRSRSEGQSQLLQAKIAELHQRVGELEQLVLAMDDEQRSERGPA